MEQKTVWIVEGNTDLTEGRGKMLRLAFCEEYATAVRIGKGKYVQGMDCPIVKGNLFKPDGMSVWFGPVTVEGPTEQDLKSQEKINERDAVLAKAVAAGLTDHEIDLIKSIK